LFVASNVQDSFLAGFRQIFDGAGAIVDVGDYGSALGTSALLKLTRDGLRKSIVSL
jgi:hypothetical protein